MDAFIARQPIFDTNQSVYAYELLFRQDDQNFFDGNVSSNIATSILLMNSFFTFGLEKLVGNEKAFINFDKDLILADIPKILNKSAVVIELLEDIVPTPEFINKIIELKHEGYIIALDDYVEGYLYDELTHLSDIIKVDFLGNTKEQIRKIALTWKRKGKRLLAEKVETIEVFEWAKTLGFDYFQGYFFSKPSMIKSKKLEDNALQYIRLMKALNEKEPDNRRISAIIESDITLTYKLLKLANSNFTKSRQISSVPHALAMLGTNAFEKWLSLALVQNLGKNKPAEIIKTSMIRSAFMGNICEETHLKKNIEEVKLIGVLSVIDVLLEKEMSKVVEELPLSEQITKTLTHNDSQYQPIYDLVLAYERAEFSKLEALAQLINYDLKLMPEAYYQAVKWAEALYEYMSS